MILIYVAVYDTVENKRTEYTKATYNSLKETINPDTTEVIFIDNDSCEETKRFLASIEDYVFHVITNETNEGTAMAINRGIHTFAKPGDFIVKLDNDVTFGEYGWADRMREVIEDDPKIGILGLKRKDLPNQPLSKEYPTVLKYQNHNLGDKWNFRNVVEVCGDLIGTCLMLNPLLVEKIGYLWQPALYGFDDVLYCTRSRIAGFYNAFYPCIEIEHIDTGSTPYAEWKRNVAGIYLNSISKIEEEYNNGTRSIYYNPFD